MDEINENPDDWYLDRIRQRSDSKPELGIEAIFRHKLMAPIFIKCRWNVDDHLYVKEAYQFGNEKPDRKIGEICPEYSYKASEIHPLWKWKPSLFMPKSAARIWLEITEIRCERLHDINHEEAANEGVEMEKIDREYQIPGWKNYHYGLGKKNHEWDDEWLNDPISSYQTLWESINGIESWDKNPWVWVIRFERLTNH